MGGPTKHGGCTPGTRTLSLREGPSEDLDGLLAEIGQTIAARRKQCDLTQEQLALRAGCSTNTVIAVESGKRNVTVRSLAMISAAFGFRLADLFPGSPGVDLPAELIPALSDEVATAREALSRTAQLVQKLSDAALPKV